MVMTIGLLAIALALACFSVVLRPLIAIYRGKCWHCMGTGTVLNRKERIPTEELSAREHAEYLCEGTHFYRAESITCPRCNGSGLKTLKG